jgi:hypothetical protein
VLPPDLSIDGVHQIAEPETGEWITPRQEMNGYPERQIRLVNCANR